MSALNGTYTFETSLPLMPSFTATVPVAEMVSEALDASETRIANKVTVAAAVAAVIGGVIAGAMVAVIVRR